MIHYVLEIKETFIRLIFNITVEGKLNDFLGCNIIRDPENLICWLHQPHLIEKLKKKVGTHVIQMIEEVLLDIFFTLWEYLYHGNQKCNHMSLYHHQKQNMWE